MEQDLIAEPERDVTEIDQWWKQIDWGCVAGITVLHIGAACTLVPLFLPAGSPYTKYFFSWEAVILFLVLQFVCGISNNIGMHRLLTHRTYKTWKWFEYFLAAMATLNWQGGPIWWVASHRLHHRLSDRHGDPHSPRNNFFWGHIGWMMVKDPRFASLDSYGRYAADINKDPVHRFIETYRVLWHFVVAGICYLIAGWPGVFWGACLRTVAIVEVTGLVNSASHRFGYRTFNTNDDSRNLWWVAYITYGEWHHNHHAYPNSAQHGFYWWESDLSFQIITALSWVGITWDIRTPPKTLLAAPRPTGLLEVPEDAQPERASQLEVARLTS